MKHLLTTHEAAPLLSIDQHTVAEHCKSGRLPAVKRAGRWFIHRDDIRRFLKVPRPVGRPIAKTA